MTNQFTPHQTKQGKSRLFPLSSALATILALMMSLGVAAQGKVSGKIMDGDGKPITGVTIVVKGTHIGQTSDANGNYTINAAPNSTLQISFIGYESMEVPVGSSTKIDLNMQESRTMLDDVVVVGYGTQKRSDVTGSIASAKIEDVIKAPVASIGEALAGRVAGVNVTSLEGEPGSGIEIIIRGQNSLTQSSAPLYVIDGFPIENFNPNTLNTADIASFDVLKDASATAIYGARGANGVIMITTNRGRVGAAKVTYEGSYAFQQVINKMDLMDPYDFVQMQFEIDPSRARSHYLKPDGQGRETRSLDFYRNIAQVDWQEMAFRNASLNNHTIGVTGGSESTKYAASFGYMNQDGVVTSSSFERFNGRLSLDQQINKNWKVGVNINYAETKRSGVSVRMAQTNAQSDLSAMYNLWGYRNFHPDLSIEEFMNEDMDTDITDLNTYGSRHNPIRYLDNEERDLYASNLRADIYLEYKFLKYFTLKLTGGINKNWDREELYYNGEHPSSLLMGGAIKGIHGSGTYRTNNRLVNENMIMFDRSVKKHTIGAVVDFSVEKYKSIYFNASAEQIARDMGMSVVDEGIPMSIGSAHSQNSRISALARVNYNYDSRYYMTGSIRADASSKFGPDNKWGYFPSGSVMWRISNEKFLKDNKAVSDLRVRASYGITGNDRIGDFDYMSLLGVNEGYGYSWNNSTNISGAQPTQLGNSGLKWESTASFDAAIEAGFINNRIQLTAEYYNKKTYDLLLRAKVALSSGYATQMQNIGKVQNRGWEFTLNAWILDKKDFSWNSSFNISFNNSKVLALEGTDVKETASSWTTYSSVALYRAQVGQPIAMFQGVKWSGNYQISDFNWQNNNDPSIPHTERTYTLKPEIPANGTNRNLIQPGHIKYQNQNDDLVINSSDIGVIGNPNPKFTGGWTNTFAYKNFDLNVFLQFSYGNQIMNGNTILFEGTYRYGLNQFASYTDRWSPTNSDSKNYVPKGGNTGLWSDKNLEDGSYLRLKTIQLGYKLPSKWLKKIRIDNIRAYVSAQNLHTWTKYSGFDPEVSVYNSALTPGLDYLAYPRARTFAFGLQITF